MKHLAEFLALYRHSSRILLEMAKTDLVAKH